jgi:hypothetical protein
MTWDAFFLQNGGTIIAAIILAVPGMLGAYWSKRGMAVSRRNEGALNIVQLKQDTNKIAIIEGVKHELNNGSGDVIAAKMITHIVPVIEEIKKTIPVEIAKTAEVVAAALVEAKAVKQDQGNP